MKEFSHFKAYRENVINGALCGARPGSREVKEVKGGGGRKDGSGLK